MAIEFKVTATPKGGVRITAFKVWHKDTIVCQRAGADDKVITGTGKVADDVTQLTFDYVIFGKPGAELEVSIKRTGNGCIVYQVKNPGFTIQGDDPAREYGWSDTDLPIDLANCL